MQNNYEFEGLYLASAYTTIVESVNEIFSILVNNDSASNMFLENNETDIITKTYAMIKNSDYLTNNVIKSLVSQNTIMVLSYALLHNDDSYVDITSDQLYKAMDYFSNVIHKNYHF